MVRIAPYLLLFVSFAKETLYAQKSFRDTTPSYAYAIFEDNFGHDAVGTFPSKWFVSNSKLDSYKTRCRVEKDRSKSFLDISKEGVQIQPNVDGYVLPTNFTVEFDFKFEDAKAVFQADFAAGSSGLFSADVHLHTHIDHNIALNIFSPGGTGSATYAGSASAYAWRHLKVSFSDKKVVVILDSTTTKSVPNTHVAKFFSIFLKGPMKITNFRLTNVESVRFSNLLNEKRLVTHAILFDINKSVIKPGSQSFIDKLTAFLKTNPAVSLEIDGHTDNDGDAAMNMTLSQARANEVRKYLIAAGIDANRLFAKGFGDTKPVRPNTTPEGKAENRRVEFIKL